MTRLRLSALAGVIATCGLLVTSCARPAPEEVESDTVVPVVVEVARRGIIRSFVHATGTVTPAPGAELLVVAPEIARIAELPRGEGDRVIAGDLLVRFDIPATRAEVSRQRAEIVRAEAQGVNARAAQTRARDLFDRGVAARKDVEDADRAVAEGQAALAQGQAALTAAESAVERATVRAPFSGVIARRTHNPGDLVEPAAADPVLRLVDLRRLEVTALIPLADVGRIVAGARARLGGGPDAALTVVSPPTTVDASTGAAPARLAFGRVGTTLPIGAPIQIDIDAEVRPDVVLVPIGAIVREGDDTAVFVVSGEKAERRAVVLGLIGATDVEVRSGIAAGDRVISRGHAGLPDGAVIVEEKRGNP